ncbi:MAG: rRNA maturation RNase YbeY [Candidatus Omnitrophica bacterium]|nr:rRNA maturation RNase YbeY [Candidatus Omnitrophota bacterium]
MSRITIKNLNSKKKVDLSKIKKTAKRVLKELNRKNVELNIAFLSNQKIRVLNRKYLKIDAATDVIAFPGGDPAEKKNAVFLGDIAISSDKAAQNAKIYGQFFKDEITLYVIHGILHLAGYEDTTKASREKMRRKEDVLFQEIKRSR